MTGRLNKRIREALVEDIMVYRWTKPAELLVAKRAAIRVEIFEHLYGKHLKRIEAYPDGDVPSTARYSAQIGATVNGYMRFNGASSDYNQKLFRDIEAPKAVTRRVRSKEHVGWDNGTTVLGVLEATHPLAIAYERIQNETETMQAEYNESRKVLEANLAGVHTFKRLLEQWPEIEPFAKSYYKAEQDRLLPVVQRDHLNGLFYLPKPEEQANA